MWKKALRQCVILNITLKKKDSVLDVFSSVKEGVAHFKALFLGVHHPNFVAPLLISIDMSQRACTPVLVLLSTL